MYQIAYIGRWETLPETAAAICDYDTSKLEVLLQGGLDHRGVEAVYSVCIPRL